MDLSGMGPNITRDSPGHPNLSRLQIVNIFALFCYSDDEVIGIVSTAPMKDQGISKEYLSMGIIENDFWSSEL
jgi:hypothetical protein